jgi:hypothetical protein
MRLPAAVAAVATLFTLGATPAVADDATVTLVLEVGQKATVGGASGKCDDLSVATITLDAQAVITGLKPGRTTCSARVGGFLRVYDVTVNAPPAGGDPGGPRQPGEAGRR